MKPPPLILGKAFRNRPALLEFSTQPKFYRIISPIATLNKFTHGQCKARKRISYRIYVLYFANVTRSRKPTTDSRL